MDFMVPQVNVMSNKVADISYVTSVRELDWEGPHPWSGTDVQNLESRQGRNCDAQPAYLNTFFKGDLRFKKIASQHSGLQILLKLPL